MPCLFKLLTHSAAISCCAGLGCSVAYDADRPQCASASECVQLDPTAECIDQVCVLGSNSSPIETQTQWGCVGDPTRAIMGNRFPLVILDPVALRTVPGVEIRSCKQLDIACNSPYSVVVTDSDGYAEVPLPEKEADRKGVFLELQLDPYMPTLIPALSDTMIGDDGVAEFHFFQTADLEALAQLVHTELQPDKGTLGIGVSDCFGEYAAGISIDVHPAVESEIFYLINGFPESGATATSDEGGAGVVNVNPGQITLHMAFAETGDVLTHSSLPVRSGWFTQGIIVDPRMRYSDASTPSLP